MNPDPAPAPIARPWVQYLRRDLRAAAIAGLTVAVMGVPQAMAYAMIAELLPVYGLYTAIISCAVAAILGSSRLMDVVSHTPAGQPLPLHMLAAVQFLLEPSDRLALYYPTLTDEPRPVGDGAVDNGLAESLEEFVIANERKIIELLETRITQTNEVGRLGAIMPGLCLVHRRTGLPLSPVESGTSAGLLLGWPDYFFDYGEQGELGNPLSSVRMRPELRGQEKLPLTDTMPPVATRVGLDLSPLDVADADDARWLAALVWPDHGPRIARLRHAIDTIRDNPPKLITANAPDRLPGVLASLPEDSPGSSSTRFRSTRWTLTRGPPSTSSSCRPASTNRSTGAPSSSTRGKRASNNPTCA